MTRMIRVAAVAIATIAVLATGELSAYALCAGVPESGTWQSESGSDPFRVQIRQGNCEAPGGGGIDVTVWVKQASGALYQRGVFAGQSRTTSDGGTWIYAQYGVGGYLAQQWVRAYSFSGRSYLRVWIYWQSLDSKPSATTDQWFDPTIASAGSSVELRNLQAGRCLDADLAHIDADGDSIQAFSCWNALNQNWYFGANGSIVNAASGKCLDADLGTIWQDVTRVQLWQCNGGANQRWYRPGDGTLRNGLSGHCLDADLAGITSEGDRVTLFPCWGGQNQQWAE